MPVDELRAKTDFFKKRIKEAVANEESEIALLKKQIEEQFDLEPTEKEKIYNQIDKLEKLHYEKTEDVLNDILPEAFSVMKAAAALFKENDTIEVTANDLDRNLAAIHDFVSIKGDKAYYSSS